MTDYKPWLDAMIVKFRHKRDLIKSHLEEAKFHRNRTAVQIHHAEYTMVKEMVNELVLLRRIAGGENIPDHALKNIATRHDLHVNKDSTLFKD